MASFDESRGDPHEPAEIIKAATIRFEIDVFMDGARCANCAWPLPEGDLAQVERAFVEPDLQRCRVQIAAEAKRRVSAREVVAALQARAGTRLA